jgi:hypothetical protein
MQLTDPRQNTGFIGLAPTMVYKFARKPCSRGLFNEATRGDGHGMRGIFRPTARSFYLFGSARKYENRAPGEGPRSYSNLAQDEIMLAADMRKLRRDLRRSASQIRIARERDEIRQDWLDIVAQRGLKTTNVSPALVNFGRFLTRRNSKKTDV